MTTPNNGVKSRGRPPKLKCMWCLEVGNQLNYILPVANGQKQFCSIQCLQQFKKTIQVRGNLPVCIQCGDMIKSTPVNLEISNEVRTLCSNKCLSKYQKKQEKAEKVVVSEDSSNGSLPGAFDWDRYLIETNSIAAPQSCFKQHPKPPKNEFEEKMKLEALDPRSTTSICIATVIAAHGCGPRLRLRLDGSDDKNDFWRLVDSGEIHPVGYCDQQGEMLQPPLGFTSNVSHWPVFLAKTLNNAKMAPSRIFKPEPPSPQDNYFKVGMKLEAVDKKNPQLICVATIGEVNKDKVYISFDGWKGAFDYWCRFDSRDIFPVGWCAKSGHHLQPPNNKKIGNRFKIKVCGIPPIIPIQDTKAIKDEPGKDTETCITSTTVSIFLNSGCHAGSFFDKDKLKAVEVQWGPDTITNCVKKCITTLLSCAKDCESVIHLLKRENGNTAIETVINSVQYSLILPQLKTADEMWDYFSYLTSALGSCTNFLGSEKVVMCSEPDCVEQVVKVEKESENINKRNSPDSSQIPKKLFKSSTAIDTSDAIVEGEQSQSSTVVQGSVSKSSSSIPSEVSTSLPDLPTDPSTWSVEHVIQHLSSCDPILSTHAELFRSHEIDGKALLLLTSEMMMKYMNLKLGPALKICNIVNKIRPRRLSHPL